MIETISTERRERLMHRALVVLAACLALLVAACGRNEPLLSASPVAPTAPAAPTVGIPDLTFTLSGVVAEDGRPIENALVEVWWLCGRGCGRANQGMTDAAGRYKVAGLPEGETVWAIARKDGYVQQCVATTTLIFRQGNASLDVRLTAIANLSTARPLSGPGSRAVSGAVFEATPTGRQPVEGASVEVYSEALSYYGEAVAFTRSDPAGRYLLCGLPQGPISYLYAAKQGYSVNVPVEPGTDAIVDIVFPRR